KAGILKAGVPVVVSRQTPEARATILAEARRIGAPVVDSTRAEVLRDEPREDPACFTLRTPSGARHAGLALSLRGDHQIGNAVTAVLLTEILRERGGLAIDDEAVRRGLARTIWPGRLDLVKSAEGSERADILLDGAHNPDGCATLVAYLLR